MCIRDSLKEALPELFTECPAPTAAVPTVLVEYRHAQEAWSLELARELGLSRLSAIGDLRLEGLLRGGPRGPVASDARGRCLCGRQVRLLPSCLTCQEAVAEGRDPSEPPEGPPAAGPVDEADVDGDDSELSLIGTLRSQPEGPVVYILSLIHI